MSLLPTSAFVARVSVVTIPLEQEWWFKDNDEKAIYIAYTLSTAV
jgi:hypothetical protein